LRDAATASKAKGRQRRTSPGTAIPPRLTPFLLLREVMCASGLPGKGRCWLNDRPGWQFTDESGAPLASIRVTRLVHDIPRPAGRGLGQPGA